MMAEDLSDSSSKFMQVTRSCSDCGTCKTPLWRGGPSGPKSVCNACGIRNRKRRRAMLVGGLKKKESSESRLMQRSTMVEIEQAALLLMALSCPTLFIHKCNY